MSNYEKAISDIKQTRGWNGLSDSLLEEALERTGHEPGKSLKLLGDGTAAHVFWLSDKKRVLKITGDLPDAEASAVVMKRPAKSIVHVYDVFQVKGAFFIVEEKLTPLSGSEKSTWKNFDDWRDSAYSPNQARDDEGVRIEQGLETMLSHMQLTDEWLHHLEAAFQSDPPTNFDPNLVMKQLRQWARDLTQRNILWGDIYWENFMSRGHQIVISDLGYGRVFGAPRIPRLATRIQ